MKKIIISNRQLTALTALYICGPSTLVIASSASAIAKQDAWLSAGIAILVGLFPLWLITFLCGRYPDKNYIEIVQLLMGKWL